MPLRSSIVSMVTVTLVACGGQPAPPAAKASPPTPAPAPTNAASPPSAVAPAIAAPDGGTATAVAHLDGAPHALPGATAPAGLDYIAVERSSGRLWVPVPATGSVDVLDAAAHDFVRVDGFKTAEREVRGKKRTMGPSAVTLGDGVAYIGNRASSEVCAIDMKTLKAGKCVKMPAGPDGVAYVAASKEVWVTMPSAQSLAVLDASKPDAPKLKPSIKVDGEPEGYAVDEGRGLFFTNLEDKGGTLAIDVKTHAVKAKWSAGCDAEGPRGVAVDTARNWVIVACTDHVQVLDAGHDGALLGKLDTGGGVDNIDYLEGKQLLYVASGKAARLTVAHIGDGGQLTIVANGDTAAGARNVVADARGTAYVADSLGARVLAFAPH